MPIVVDTQDPAVRLLTGPDGSPLARFRPRTRAGRPFGDFFELLDGVDARDAVPVVLAELAGTGVSAAPDVARALHDAGATPGRHAHVLSRDLRSDPAPAAWVEPETPADLRLTPVDRPAEEVSPLV